MKKKIRFIKAYDQDVLGLGRTFALGDEQEFDNGVADSLITLRIAEAVSDGGDGATQTGARQIVIQLPEGFAPEQVERLLSTEPTEEDIQRAMDLIAPENPANAGLPADLVPENQRQVRRPGARVTSRRDTDGDEALYVQTFRLLCAEAGQNRAAVQQQLMHMARAGLYGDRAQAAMQRTEAFPMPAQQRDSGFLFTDDNGGPFLPVIVASEIQRIATEAGFIEALVTTYDLRPGDTLRVPNLPGIVEPSAVGEGAEIGGKGFDPNKTEVRPKKWGAVVSWTNEVGEQQGAQYVRHLVDAVGTGYGWAVDYSILQADGTATWHSLVGLLTLAGLSEHTLAATKTAFEDFTFDDYLKLWEQPSVGVWRNVRAVLHHHFKFILKRMTDPEGHYIFQPGQDPESGNITYTEAMPSRAESAADTVFGIVGDWRKIIMARHMGIQARLFESGSVKDVAGNVVNLITQDGLALRFIRHWNWTLADAMKPAFGRVKTAAV